MLKEERSLRTRLVAGSKRRIARRPSDDFCFWLSTPTPPGPPPAGARDSREY
jgi:hypothetical protein